MGADSTSTDPQVGTTTAAEAPAGRVRGRRFSKRRCGQCGAPELHTTTPEGWARWVPAFTGLATVRCPACGWRRVRPRSWTEELQPQGPLRASQRRQGRVNRARARETRQLLATLLSLTIAALLGWMMGTR